MSSNVNIMTRVRDPEVRLNQGAAMGGPFAVIDHGDVWFSSADAEFCRRVAAAWSEAADLLEAAQARAAGKEGTGG